MSAELRTLQEDTTRLGALNFVTPLPYVGIKLIIFCTELCLYLSLFIED